MPPGAAARCTPVPCGRSRRIALRRIGVVVFAEPIRAPLVDVLAQIENAERVGGLLADRPRSVDLAAPSAEVLRPREWRLLPPPGLPAFAPPPSGAPPLHFRGEPLAP